MRLSELVRAAGLPPISRDCDISGITADSREVGPGMMFAALAGARADGARFVPEAVAAGAEVVLAGERAEVESGVDVPIVRAGDPRRALALMASAFHAPQPNVLVAVTGTNGKTSVASFTEQIWRHLGIASGSIGTLGVSGLQTSDQVSLTSPDPVTLHRVLQAFARRDVGHVAVEASSHGLAQKRLDGVKLAGGAFTNFSRDHLDYHASFEEYLDAKLRLFRELLPEGGAAVVNLGGEANERAASAAREARLRLMTVGFDGDDLELVAVHPKDDHLEVEVVFEDRRRRIRIPLVGAFQAENAMVAAALATSAGDCGLDEALDALEHVNGASGRLELVGATDKDARVFVDYAHTPDALAVVLAALKPHARGRLIVVFGAGGDRDPGKRSLMGEAVAQLADEAIVTDDNPRSEDPAVIRRAIMEGAPNATEIGNRREAIAEGIRRLKEGDVLLVAGKGHEQGQIVGNETLPFSDHHEIRTALGASEAA